MVVLASLIQTGHAGTFPPSVGEVSKLMPARVVVASAHGGVFRSGSGFEFSFARAPLLEVVEDVARVFSAPILCPEPAASEFTGSFSADRLSEALARVASGTGRRARLDGAAWTVEPDLPEDPREVTWSDPCFSAGEAQGP